jgi:hypothetical protein
MKRFTTFSLLGLALIAALQGVWIAAGGSVMDERHMAGSVLAFALSVLLIAQALGRMARDGGAQIEKVVTEALETGVWTGPEGLRLEVRWKPVPGVFEVKGNLDRDWHLAEWSIWCYATPLGRIVAEGEEYSDLRPVADAATRAMRARLDVDGEHVERVIRASLSKPGPY